MARVAPVSRDDLKPEDRHYFDEVVAGRGVAGPYIPLLHSPKLAALVSSMVAYLRSECEISDNIKEVAILTTARHIHSQFEFSGHAALARKANVSEQAIRAIAQGAAPKGLAGDEELAYRFTRELLAAHQVSEATFQAAKTRLGVQSTVEMTTIIGVYLLLGCALAAFDVELPPGIKPELL